MKSLRLRSPTVCATIVEEMGKSSRIEARNQGPVQIVVSQNGGYDEKPQLHLKEPKWPKNAQNGWEIPKKQAQNASIIAIISKTSNENPKLDDAIWHDEHLKNLHPPKLHELPKTIFLCTKRVARTGVAGGYPLRIADKNEGNMKITGWWLSPTPLKNRKVSWDDEIPNIWKNRKCSKPPTR